MPIRNDAHSALLVAASIALVAACGGNSNGSGSTASRTLDCAWLQGPNCWKSVVSAVAACMPTSEGTFSADRRTCNFASGEQLSFATPFGRDPPYRFSIGTCVSLDQPDALNIRLTSRAGTVTTHGDAQAHTLQVTCPDGTSYVADLGGQSPLLSCNGAEALLPDTGWLTEGPQNSLKFYLRGADTENRALTIWACH